MSLTVVYIQITFLYIIHTSLNQTLGVSEPIAGYHKQLAEPPFPHTLHDGQDSTHVEGRNSDLQCMYIDERW